MKKTKILCTFGPAADSDEIIQSMVDAGMNGVRINSSHGDFDQYARFIHRIRRFADIPIVLDTQGPKIRLRMRQPLCTAENDVIRIGFSPDHEFYLDANIYDHLHVGDRALIDDGAFDAVILEKSQNVILLQFKNEGCLVSGRAVNFPGKALPLPPLTEKDIRSIQFARDQNIDYIALSFTRSKEDVLACKSRIDGSPVKIIAKIENQQGVDNFDEILEHVDGVMIARGDMGVELPPEEVPMVQKKLIRACCSTSHLVITATQMLQSMIDHPRPTRAEMSDVANAILDGSDVVMLSGETATGRYPVEAVRVMNRIAAAAEPFIDLQQPANDQSVETALCDSVRNLCVAVHIDKIVTITRRGRTAKMISRLRLQPPILALTAREEAFRELHLYFGVVPVIYESLPPSIQTAAAGMHLYQQGYIQPEDLILFVSGEYNPSVSSTNTLQILSMKDMIRYSEKNIISQ
ncbi:MAG: pyruvate kinase [Candidatus Omnitrophica bacterium]|nr:pyruvate kinase [Candidatus Omnitrophota bacterium]